MSYFMLLFRIRETIGVALTRVWGTSGHLICTSTIRDPNHNRSCGKLFNLRSNKSRSLV